ncbi:hypothetical protein LCGC14_0524620 [marine sediment metagenome]|uniref:Uncharacterized protein n=1 Tax=marine sediment metagenome TaxID=412755 RepID=A0A0F9SFT0_9ZZZZ
MAINLNLDNFYDKSRGTTNFNYQEIKCDECNRKLKICQAQRKVINFFQEFAIFTYYCRKCNSTYFVFKFIKRREGFYYDKTN